MKTVNLTDYQIQELARCYNDPVYFINNYCWIEVKEQSKIVPAKLYPYQEKILDWMVNKKNGLVLKSRRVGGSTVVALYLSWAVNFRRGINALLLSRTEKDAIKLLNKVKFSFFNIKKHTSNDFALAEDASWMLNTVAFNNQQLFATAWLDDNGNVVSTSEAASLTTTSDSGRSESATFVFIDEMAFLSDQEGANKAARITTTRGGHWIIVSTPNGTGDSFHSMCMRAERGENETYEFLRVHWSEADITSDQIKAATEGLAEASVSQEMEMEFISSGDPVFNHVHLAACYKPVEDYPEILTELQKYRALIDLNHPDYCYYIGVDTAIGKLNKRGGKRDYHSFTALTKSGIQAFSYHSKEDSLTEWSGNTERIAGQSVQIVGIVTKLHSKWPGIMHVETNGPGHAVYVNHQNPEDARSSVVPKDTNFKSKDQLIRQLILAVESHSIIITDKFTYQCMLVYQRGAAPGTYAAPNGDYYDDPVMSLAFAWDSLVSNGMMEFSWGSGTDNLIRVEQSSDAVNEINLSRMGYGPAALNTEDSTQRLSTFVGENNLILFDSDLDISKLKEPEFNYVT